jgi:hypothetical protein
VVRVEDSQGSDGLPGSRERYQRSTCSSEQRQRCGRRGLNKTNKAQISRSRSGLRQLVELQGVALLVVAHGQFGRDGLEVTEETACAVVGAGGEIEFGARRPSGVVTSGGGAVAGAESPEAANGERLSGCVLDQADELTCGEIVGGNGAGTIRRSGTGELAYEQIVAKDAEVERRKSYTPWRIEPSVSKGLPSWWRTKVTTMSLPMAWTLKGTKSRGRRSSVKGFSFSALWSRSGSP